MTITFQNSIPKTMEEAFIKGITKRFNGQNTRQLRVFYKQEALQLAMV